MNDLAIDAAAPDQPTTVGATRTRVSIALLIVSILIPLAPILVGTGLLLTWYRRAVETQRRWVVVATIGATAFSFMLPALLMLTHVSGLFFYTTHS